MTLTYDHEHDSIFGLAPEATWSCLRPRGTLPGGYDVLEGDAHLLGVPVRATAVMVARDGTAASVCGQRRLDAIRAAAGHAEPFATVTMSGCRYVVFAIPERNGTQ